MAIAGSLLHRLILTLALIIAVAIPVGYSSPAAASSPSIVYLAPAPIGKDTNNGITPSTPVLTLARAQGVLKSMPSISTDVEVRIAPGTYTAGPITWNFYVPDHSISFIPTGYQAGVP